MKKNLWKNFEEVVKKIKGSKHILLLLDYDGTLTPIVTIPDKAILSSSMRLVLKKLTKVKNLTLGIISGRQLEDVRRKVRVKGIIYAGNHGMEVEGGKFRFVDSLAKKSAKIIKLATRCLDKKLSSVKGVLVENKKYSLSLHYRMVDEKEVSLVKKIFNEETLPFLKKKNFKVTQRKKVLELSPLKAWNKGNLTLWILEKLALRQKKKILPIYIGDDITDEAAFKAVNQKKGISILVGKKKSTFASCYLNSCFEVELFLNKLITLYL